MGIDTCGFAAEYKCKCSVCSVTTYTSLLSRPTC